MSQLWVPPPPVRRNRAGAVLAVVAVGFLLGFAGCVGLALVAAPHPGPRSISTSPSLTVPRLPATVVPATQIGDDYDANKVAADGKYKGHRWKTTATVINIDPDRVAFGDMTSKVSITQASCELADPAQALTLTRGGKATFEGVITGQEFGVIVFTDCSVTPASA